VNMDLDGAVAVITGAGGGIGRSMALAFASQGASIVVADIDGTAAEIVAGEIEMRGGTAVAAAADVVKVESVEALADRCFSTFAKVEVLCNNEGVAMRPFRAAWVASVADYKWMMDVNYFGVVHGILAFVPRMRQQTGHKHVVNTSSFAALDFAASNGAYGRRRLRCRACPTHCGKSFANTVTISGLRSSIPVRYARGSLRPSGFARRMSGPQAVASNHTDRRMTASTWRILKFLIPSRSATSWSMRCARTHRHRSLILRQPISSKLDSRLSSLDMSGRRPHGHRQRDRRNRSNYGHEIYATRISGFDD
jgi:NADP-dependent 3-hydroxy acid dehydrogenase YdfG